MGLSQQKRVTVVVPTKNEHKNIVPLINGINESYPESSILVVDDSDDDRTKILANENGAKVINGQRKGLGQAIIDGIKASESEIIVVMDCDLSHPPSKIPELVNACQNGHKFSVGSRYVKGGSIVGWTKKRKIISAVASAIAYPISGVRDGTSGYFAFNRSILDGVNLEASSWKIMLEILVKSRAKAIEIPIEFKDRQAGESKFRSKEMVAYLKHLVKLSLYKYWLFQAR